MIETERLLDAPPRSRNEELASLLRSIGFCEERGSGIDHVAAACEAEYLPAPEFRVVNARTVATVFRRRSFASLTQRERSHAVYLHACLRYANHTTVTAATIRERFGLRDRAVVSHIIADGITAGLIRLAEPADGGKPAAFVPHLGLRLAAMSSLSIVRERFCQRGFPVRSVRFVSRQDHRRELGRGTLEVAVIKVLKAESALVEAEWSDVVERIHSLVTAGHVRLGVLRLAVEKEHDLGVRRKVAMIERDFEDAAA